jgi:hypothetical protein
MGASQEMLFNSPSSTLLFHFSRYGFSLTPLPVLSWIQAFFQTQLVQLRLEARQDREMQASAQGLGQVVGLCTLNQVDP